MLVRIRPGQECTGVLTPWAAEEQVLWEHFGRPLHMYSWIIDGAAVHLPPGLTIGDRRFKWRSICSFDSHPLPLRDDDLVGSVAYDGWRPDSPGPELSVRQMLGTFGCSCDTPEWTHFKTEVPLMLIPNDVLTLIAQRSWKTLAACAGWHRRSVISLLWPRACIEAGNAWPSSGWLCELRNKQKLSAHCPRSTLPLEPRHAATLCSQLRQWALKILSSAGDDVGQVRMELSDAVLRLEHSAGLGTSGNPQLSDIEQKADKKVKNYMCACLLRDRNQLQTASARILAASFPSLAPQQMKSMTGYSKLEGSDQVSKSQLYIDSALCTYWGKRLAPGSLDGFDDGPCYLWADSSPQFGTDWLLSVMLLIRASDLPECAASFIRMVSTVDEIQVPQADLSIARLAELIDLRHSCGETMASTMHMHRQVPMGLGSGSSDVHQKVRCLVQKLLVESTSMSAARALLSRVRGFCVDMGTELSACDLAGHGVDAPDYLPEWMRASAPFEAEVDEQFGGHSSGSADLANHVFPLALLSAGTLHICNNLAKDMDKCLPGWANFMEGFTCMAYLLHHEWLRVRIVGRCLLGSPHENLKYLFDEAMR